MAQNKNKKRIKRNRSSKIWIETLEQRQLLAPIIGPPDTIGLESLNQGPTLLMKNVSLSPPFEGPKASPAFIDKGLKPELNLDTEPSGIIIKII